jgi:hypothetical protein
MVLRERVNVHSRIGSHVRLSFLAHLADPTQSPILQLVPEPCVAPRKKALIPRTRLQRQTAGPWLIGLQVPAAEARLGPALLAMPPQIIKALSHGSLAASKH